MSRPRSLRDFIFQAVPGLAVTESLFESVSDAVFCIKNRQRQYVAVNPAFVSRVRIGGREAIIGRTARDIFPPALAAGYEQQDDAVFATGREIRDKLEMITSRDGSTGWYLACKVPVRDALGNIIALAGISTDLRTPTASDPLLAGVAGALEQIRDRYDEPLRIDALSRAAGLSAGQFERRMRHLFGISARQVLTKTRIEAAAARLAATDDAIGAIALGCGFYDQSTLCRQFRHATGMNPTEYRAARRG